MNDKINLRLFPKEEFEKDSIKSINKIINHAEKLLEKWEIPIPESLEFYDSLEIFINRILNQVENYGLTKEQSKEFVKASLNSGTYGTFDIKDNSIIEMNFNPYFKGFYPAIHFLKLIIHESLHLFLYSNFKEDFYSKKFKFNKEEYSGDLKYLQLDEGFADFLTEKILENFNFDEIKQLPIYCSLLEPPKYKKEVEGFDIEEFNKKFDELYEENSKKGYERIKNKFKDKKDLKVIDIINFIKQELSKHK